MAKKVCRDCGKVLVGYHAKRCSVCAKASYVYNKVCERCEIDFITRIGKQKFCDSCKLPKRREYTRNRGIRSRHALGSHTEREWLKLKELYYNKCAICSISEGKLATLWKGTVFTKLTRDHITPLAKGGSDFIENIRPLCVTCNSRKRHSTIDVVYCCGVFDMYHVGHLSLLKQAREVGDYLIVGVIKDKAVKAHKGPQRPLISENNRLEIIRAVKYVDSAIFQDDFDPTDNIANYIRKGLKVSILVLGEDQSHINDSSIDRFNLKRVIIKRPKDGNCTSEIIKKIKEN